MATTPPDGPFRLQTRAGAVAERLRELIRSGELAPGAHLRQDDFAARFGVSTSPVREAFVALEREGLVRRHPHRGVVVFTASVEELNEVYEIRVELESLATELATRQLTDEDLSILERIPTEMRDAKPNRFVALNGDFHSRLYAAAGRPRLHAMIDGLLGTAAHYVSLNVDLYDQDYRDQVQAEHGAVVDALRSRAPRRASRAMREHLEHSARHIVLLIERSQAPESGRRTA
jgi:DNA-binding GntR family transcriptional regulator